VWATLRAKGTKKFEVVAEGKELSPPLIFQAKVSAGSVETVAYGQKVKVAKSAIEADMKQASEAAASK
jgi:hypothetical protein